MPVRLSAWLGGASGQRIQASLTSPGLHVTLLPRGVLLEPQDAARGPGALASHAVEAAHAMEADLRKQFPDEYERLGPAWTGTVQLIAAPRPRRGTGGVMGVEVVVHYAVTCAHCDATKTGIAADGYTKARFAASARREGWRVGATDLCPACR